MTGNEFFQFFLYATNWDIPMNLMMVGIAIIYLVLTTWGGHFWKGATPISGPKKLSFLFALGMYYFAMGSPLTLLAHELFSMHMLQMSILYIALPPFFLLGIPSWFVQPLLRISWLRKIGHLATKPMMVLFLFNGLLSIYHVPLIFDAIMASQMLHYVSHAILLFLSISMWYSVVCPIPESDRMKSLQKLAFIFANGVLLTPVCALIIFANTPLYAIYDEISQVAPIMSPLHDQQLGGVIMKIMQEFVYITTIGLILFRWVRVQRQKDEDDLSKWMEEEKQDEKKMGDYSWN